MPMNSIHQYQYSRYRQHQIHVVVIALCISHLADRLTSCYCYHYKEITLRSGYVNTRHFGEKM